MYSTLRKLVLKMNENKDMVTAFPVVSETLVHSSELSLRDYFAAMAMQGLLAAQVHGFTDSPAKGPFASMAYEMADAMLKAREQED